MARRSATAPVGGKAPKPLFQVVLGSDAFSHHLQLASGQVLSPAALLPWLSSADLERYLFDATRERVVSGRVGSTIASATDDHHRRPAEGVEIRPRNSTRPPGTSERRSVPSVGMAEPTIYEAMGGADAMTALAEAWHRRCLADPVLAHPFEHGVHPQHTERLAAYWTEQLGGPTAYTQSMSSYSDVVRVHSGNGPHEQMDGRAVAAFVFALDDAGIPTDERLRFQLIAWFTWATALLNHRWSTADAVPAELPMPAWGWEGTEGW